MKRLAINCPSCGCLVEGDYCESCVLWREESDRKIQNLEAELQAANERLGIARVALDKIEPMLIEYADTLSEEVETQAKAGDWVCQVIVVAREALARIGG